MNDDILSTLTEEQRDAYARFTFVVKCAVAGWVCLIYKAWNDVPTVSWITQGEYDRQWEHYTRPF
jgi:hypothetical protein